MRMYIHPLGDVATRPEVHEGSEMTVPEKSPGRSPPTAGLTHIGEQAHANVRSIRGKVPPTWENGG